MVSGITLMSAAVSTLLLGLRTPTGDFEPVACNPEIAPFQGTVKTEWRRADDPEDSRKFKLLESIEYVASNGTVWKADAGAIIDGASIPQAFWSIIGGPTTGPYRDASVIHDVYCGSKERHWEETHWAFHDGCREAGLGTRSRHGRENAGRLPAASGTDGSRAGRA